MANNYTTEALIDTINVLNKHDADFKKLCELILEASLLWNSNDEKKNPLLKRLRTMAGYYLNESDYFI